MYQIDTCGSSPAHGFVFEAALQASVGLWFETD